MQLTTTLYKEYAELTAVRDAAIKRMAELKETILEEIGDQVEGGAKIETPVGTFSTRKYYKFTFPTWVEAKRSELKEAETVAKQKGEVEETESTSLVFRASN